VYYTVELLIVDSKVKTKILVFILLKQLRYPIFKKLMYLIILSLEFKFSIFDYLNSLVSFTIQAIEQYNLNSVSAGIEFNTLIKIIN